MLSGLPLLKHLKLWVQLGTQASVFSDVYRYNPINASVRCPPLHVDLATEAVNAFFREIDSGLSTVKLEVVFIRLDIGDRMDSYPVQWPISISKLDGEIKVEVGEKWNFLGR